MVHFPCKHNHTKSQFRAFHQQIKLQYGIYSVFILFSFFSLHRAAGKQVALQTVSLTDYVNAATDFSLQFALIDLDTDMPIDASQLVVSTLLS